MFPSINSRKVVRNPSTSKTLNVPTALPQTRSHFHLEPLVPTRPYQPTTIDEELKRAEQFQINNLRALTTLLTVKQDLLKLQNTRKLG